MLECKFTFDDSPVFEGFAHGSTWNGFDNVAVSQAVLDQIIAWADSQSISGTDDNGDCFREIEAMPNGLYSLGWGFATQIVR